MSNKMWDEITQPFPSFNGCAVEVWEWISNVTPHVIIDVITNPYCSFPAAMVKVMDDNIGQLVQAFKDKGLYDNSVIVFTSDVSHILKSGQWSVWQLHHLALVTHTHTHTHTHIYIYISYNKNRTIDSMTTPSSCSAQIKSCYKMGQWYPWLVFMIEII